jgi:putative transposase
MRRRAAARQLQRRYMQLEGLQALSDNQPARLSAVLN